MYGQMIGDKVIPTLFKVNLKQVQQYETNWKIMRMKDR